MTVIHVILMAPYIQTNNEELYLYNNDVTYYVITKSTFDWVYAAQQWYVLRSKTWTPIQSAKQLKSHSWSPN